ncbi:hypothetical protein N657DRAFT_378353 [Parathielavia appendiculata]|uniref:Uncharacterized protein n=1 Tax=Parathielavia appendiculata TaxID=2587402 RepID=A0AAN6Z3Z3_9PEZI|nr:hypothetical protein N657DRAFT_378353 [Parathielavia appendiculata]
MFWDFYCQLSTHLVWRGRRLPSLLRYLAGLLYCEEKPNRTYLIRYTSKVQIFQPFVQLKEKERKKSTIRRRLRGALPFHERRYHLQREALSTCTRPVFLLTSLFTSSFPAWFSLFDLPLPPRPTSLTINMLVQDRLETLRLSLSPRGAANHKGARPGGLGQGLTS